MMKGRVYKIISYLDDANESDVYYGSTTQKIQARFIHHLSDYKRWKNNKTTNYTTSFSLFEKYSPECCGIELMEEFDFIDDNHLKEREAYYINNNLCVNLTNPISWTKEYCQEIYTKIFNCECGGTYTYKHKSRHELTVEHQLATNSEFKAKYEENQKQSQAQQTLNKIEYKAQWYQQSKTNETKQEKLNEKIDCECGGYYTYKIKSQHFKTIQHKLGTDSEFKAKYEEEQKQKNEERKQRVKEYKKKWHQEHK